MPRIKPTPTRWNATQRAAQARFASRYKRKNARRIIQRAIRRSIAYRRNVAHMSFNRKFGFRNPYL